MRRTRYLNALTLCTLFVLAVTTSACQAAGDSGSMPNGSSDTREEQGTSTTTVGTGGMGTVGATESAATVLRIQQAGWPDTLAPQHAAFANAIAVTQLNYEGLTRFDKDLKTVPAAAERWVYNDDATAITFTLRPNLTYSDGSPLTAQDFADAVHRTLDPTDPGDYQTSIRMIKGAEAIIHAAIPTDTAKLPALHQALAVHVPDTRTIEFEFSKPTPYFHTLAGIWVMFPAKQQLVDKGGATWYEDPANQIGNGPWQITKIAKGNNVIAFTANLRYWAGRPKLDGVEFRYIDDSAVALNAYKTGEIDIDFPDANDVPTLKADPVLKSELDVHPGSCTFVAFFNQAKPPFDKQQVREAFAYAFDRDGFNRDAYKGTQLTTLTWIPPGYPGYDPDERRFAFDSAKAKALLAAAGYPEGKGLPEIKYSYWANNPAERQRAEYLAQMLQKNLGVSVILDPIENTMLQNLMQTPETFPQVVPSGWCADYPDPQDWLSIYWHSTTNFAKNLSYKNPAADALMDAADAQTDPTPRLDLYRQAQKLIVGDAPAVIIANSTNLTLVKPNVRGLDFTTQGILITGLREATLEH